MIKRKSLIVICIFILVIILCAGIIYIQDYFTPIAFVDNMYGTSTMDLEIYLADVIALVKVEGDSKSKYITIQGDKKAGTKKHKMLVTDTLLKVKEVYKGNVDLKNENITYRGNYGIVDNVSKVDLDNNPNFEKNEEYILFLKKDIASNTYYLTSGVQSKFVYDTQKKKYIAKHLEFEDINAEIERYNNTPEDERDLLGAGKGSINDI